MEKKKPNNPAVEESEVLSYNMGGYIYKVAYKQIELLSEYADKQDLIHWFRTAKSLWRKVKAGLLLSKKDGDFITKTDNIIKDIKEELINNVGRPSSKSEQSKRVKDKAKLVENLESFEQNIYEGMAKIKMWIPTTKEYTSPEAEFKATF